MSKLVDDPLDAAPFLPRLLPALRDSATNMSDPEARTVMERALAQLERLDRMLSTLKTNKLDINMLETEINSRAQLNQMIVTYIAYQCSTLTLTNDFTEQSWNEITSQLELYLEPSLGLKLEEQLKQMCKDMTKQVEKVEDDDNDEVLCDCQFTLAYGTKILLHNTRMKLKRGHKYGLIGAISSGKSTFLKSMANGSLEGFPDPTVLKTVYVQADILGELSHLSCLDYVMQDQQIIGLSKEDVLAALNDMGFNESSPAKPSHPVHTFSGGYRIKMAMVQAMLKKPDILLLDEPVKHLDVLNIAWVKNYISSLKNVTCIMVSKNRGFLTECCTDIINIDHLKLTQHRGNLESFLTAHPEYEKYYAIKEDTEMKFQFPPVSQVEGVKSKGRALMKMTNCTFTYPGNETPTIFNISAQVSMGSKTAVYGPNGHGKSTMIKVLTGEVVPQIGEVYSHENARVAYIAQHAFHHIEHHLDKTPKEYLQWRYSGMVDKEGIVKLSMMPTEEELKLQKEPFEFSWKDEETDTTKKAMKVIVEVTGNRKQNRSKEYEYEVKFKDGTEGMVDKNLMIKRGFDKKIKEVDLKIAQLTGLSIKPLTGANIEKHFKECCGLEPECISHQRISQLADGEKNLIVFGACVWNQPHIIIADEPTNFLSGRSLIALANALKTFDGGVVVITHDEEFAKHVCTQTWSIYNGILSVSGEESNWIANQEDKIKQISQAEMVTTITDRGGNTTEVKIKKKLSARDKKAKINVIKKKLDAGDELDSDEDELARENNMY
jgi:elongation factor 3